MSVVWTHECMNNLPRVVKADTHYRTYGPYIYGPTLRPVCTGVFLDTRMYVYFSTVATCYHTTTTRQQHQPGIERVQALADISRSAVYCHSNETRAPIANPPNNAQLEITTYNIPQVIHPGPCSSVGTAARDRQTDTHTDSRGQYTFLLGYASREI